MVRSNEPPLTEESEKRPWVERLPKGKPLEEELAALVGEDGDEAETSSYEHAADPTFGTIEWAQRRYHAMFRRRLGHRGSKRGET